MPENLHFVRQYLYFVAMAGHGRRLEWPIMKSFLIYLILVCVVVSATGCGSAPSNSNNSSQVAEKVCDPISDSPTEAYKRLFAAVKEKNTEKIKGEMSVKSQEFAGFLADRQKQAVEKVYQNGFTATTFAASLPEIRDERIGSCWAAVEVRNEKDQIWEDIPFVNEDGKWKLAFAEQFNGIFKSPGKSQSTKEKEASNTALGNTAPVNRMEAANANNVRSANTNAANVPNYDGPQVEPLNKKK